MKIGTFFTALFLAVAVAPVSAQDSGADNTLTPNEVKNGWTLLFNGTSLDGWKTVKGGKPVEPGQGWSVEEGIIKLDPESIAGDIVTDRKYRNFIFKVDFRIFEGSNSGIKYYVNENAKGNITSLGCEYQIVDDWNNPDASIKNGTHKTAALYDILACTKPTELYREDFNTAMIIVSDGKVIHWLNGKKVLEYVKGGQTWREGIERSKFKGNNNFARYDEGYILLQDHHSRMEFKNIKIKELK